MCSDNEHHAAAKMLPWTSWERYHSFRYISAVVEHSQLGDVLSYGCYDTNTFLGGVSTSLTLQVEHSSLSALCSRNPTNDLCTDCLVW